MVTGNTKRISVRDLAALQPLRLHETNPFMAIMPTQPYSITELAHRANIQRLKHRMMGKPQGEDRFHITLHKLGYNGRSPVEFFEEVSAAAEEAAAPVPPFEIKFDRFTKFGGNAYVLCSREGNAALRQFWERLGTSLSNRDLLNGQPDFDPHITLLYDSHPLFDEDVEPVSWVVNEFAFVISLTGKTTYLIPEPWKLRG